MKKIGIVAVLSLLTVGILTTGCGNGASSSSCDLKTATSHICTSYDFSTDTTGLAAGLEDSACKSQKGTPGSCPTTALLGTCVIKGSTNATESFYSDTMPALTAATAKAACSGTWTAK